MLFMRFSMAKTFIRKEKSGKKEKRQENLKRRTTWNFSPVSRVKKSRKVYRRQAVRFDQEEI
jgi:hypothetical protein